MAVILFSIFTSCGKDDITPPVTLIEKKDVSFLLNVADLTSKTVQENKPNSKYDQKGINDAATVIITIQDDTNNILYNRKEITINPKGNEYVTSPISLNFGTYTITEFIVLDAVDNAIFLSPKSGSLLESNITNLLPLTITVGASTNDEIGVEVLSSFNLDVKDFG